jgi:hypothetical protein
MENLNKLECHVEIAKRLISCCAKLFQSLDRHDFPMEDFMMAMTAKFHVGVSGTLQLVKILVMLDYYS